MKRLSAYVLISLVGLFMLCLSGCDEFFPSEHALDHMTVTPTSEFMKIGDSFQFSVTGVNGDGTTNNITSSVTYTSSDSRVANPDSTTKGKINAVGNGTANITISASGASTTVPVNVFAGTLQTISVTPSSQTLSLTSGTTTQQMTAKGQFSDNTQPDITNLVSWSSSDTSVATVSSSGLVTAVSGSTTGGSRTATITASANVAGATAPVTGTATITVNQ